MQRTCFTLISVLAATAASAQTLTNTSPQNAPVHSQQILNEAFGGAVRGTYSAAQNTTAARAGYKRGTGSVQVGSSASQSSAVRMHAAQGMQAHGTAAGAAVSTATVNGGAPAAAGAATGTGAEAHSASTAIAGR
ncbi:MAG TPA: hypothetical protein VGU45_17820 [Microvirga sp.]|jgi:hypothetical protein|nr:hypothetical protein [Microvirga sp.]